MVEFLHFRRWKKKEKEQIFNKGLRKCISLAYNMGELKQFGAKNCTWSFLSGFLMKIFQYFQIKICPRGQNVSIPPSFILLPDYATHKSY